MTFKINIQNFETLHKKVSENETLEGHKQLQCAETGIRTPGKRDESQGEIRHIKNRREDVLVGQGIDAAISYYFLVNKER